MANGNGDPNYSLFDNERRLDPRNRDDAEAISQAFNYRPGITKIKNAIKSALGWYTSKLDGLCWWIEQETEKGAVKDEEQLKAIISDKVEMFRSQEPDVSGGSDEPTEPDQDLNRAAPSPSRPVTGFGTDTLAERDTLNVSETSASLKFDIQHMELDQPLEWSPARDDRTARIKSPQVKLIQRALMSLGIDVGKDKDDGWYGPDTSEAVRRFQEQNGLEATGQFREYDLNVLKKVLGG